jgi:flagellar L-ring protein precursor FlgH
MGLNLAKYKGFSPQAKGELKNEFKGEGTTKRSDSLVATLSAKVVEVMDRGLLRIEGYRELNINNERQYILVRGVVRTEDISMDNTVQSTAIADAQISYSGRGVLSDKQRTGWFTRVLDYVSPF